MTVTIGLEGVSCVGKTTLAREIAQRLDAAVVACYYHIAPDKTLLPPPDSTTAAAQMAALTVLLQLEQHRYRLVQNTASPVVILDRTVDTLLAHAHAVGRRHGYDCDDHARQLALSQQIVVPELTLLLTAGDEDRERRAARRVGMPTLFYAPDFTRDFNAYFTHPLASRVVVLDTSGDDTTTTVADHALQIVADHLTASVR
ncbi:AAA family ATPase [Hamadaea tsunoensis]|uniref:AAA family ATPase n=1 Tax=Hamadaea tsunoensis TaxID=53368 RepID=UPI0004192796|nr:AAA family ATPase [Hamadaea tsunoensis]